MAEDADGEGRLKRGDAQRGGNPGTVDIIVPYGPERFPAAFAALQHWLFPPLNACTFKASGF